MPCSASAPSTRATSCSVVSALSSTRRVRRKVDLVLGGAAFPEAIVADVLAGCSRRSARPRARPVAFDLSSRSPTWITSDGILVAVAPGAAAQVLGDREALPVEVGQQEDRDSDIAERIGEHQLGLDALTFVADDRDIVPVADLGLAQHIGDAALLDGQDGAVAMVRTMRLDFPVGHIEVGVAEAEAVGPAGAVVRRPRRCRARSCGRCAARSARRAACRGCASRG